MISPVPRPLSLIEHTASVIRERLRKGEFGESLPGELALASELQVGRNTIRAALSVLEAEGLLERSPGSRRKVCHSLSGSGTSDQKAAVLLTPEPIHQLSAFTLLWLDELRRRLDAVGCRFQVRVEPAAYRRSPEASLAALVGKASTTTWILHHSTLKMQRWFADQKVRSVVAGSSLLPLGLPCVDTDFRATARHAAGRFRALGHRRLALLAPFKPLAGDEASVAGFLDGAGDAEVMILRHDQSSSGIISALRPILKLRKPPTALWVMRATHAATALTFLLGSGISVPSRMSLICGDYEPFMDHLFPQPACYRRSPELFARSLAQMISRQNLCDKQGRSHERLLMPDFKSYSTLAAAPVLK